jgi:selenide,water dikinase
MIRLTQYARGGGCAAKLRLADLTTVLAAPPCALPGALADDVVVGTEFSDDAGVVTGTGADQLVLTTDVIAPLVDDPETFGAIAATNAMSDVWAMGGQPRFALNLAFFDPAVLPLEVLHAIMAGGARACAAAGVAIVGGHTVSDPNIKYGLAVTGQVAAGQVLSNRLARAGDALVLTKALGTGVIAQAIKAGVASDAARTEAIASMTTLNGGGLAIARRHDVHALTDVTGFGLCGHLRNILRGSALSARLALGALPLLPDAEALLLGGSWPGGSKGNLVFMTPRLRWADGRAVEVPSAPTAGAEARLVLACDAQTSGGLLIALPVAQAEACVRALREQGLPAAAVGELCAPTNEAPVETIVLA